MALITLRLKLRRFITSWLCNQIELGRNPLLVACAAQNCRSCLICLDLRISLVDNILFLCLAYFRILGRGFNTFLLYTCWSHTFSIQEILSTSERLSLLLIALSCIIKWIIVRNCQSWVKNWLAIVLFVCLIFLLDWLELKNHCLVFCHFYSRNHMWICDCVLNSFTHLS